MSLITLENLLALIFQAGGTFTVKNGKLVCSPRSLAEKYQDGIREHKRQILISLGHCPECAGELIREQRDFLMSGNLREHSYCPSPGHYDKWERGTFTT
jgi:hypothetical protein